MSRIKESSIFRILQNALQNNETELNSVDKSRRQFVKNSSAALFSTLLLPQFNFSANHQPRVVIVGGGIAGLSTLHTLKKAGISAKLYEGSNRLGGRILTSQNLIGEGTYSELGGEFIDESHTDMLALIKEFNLSLLDTKKGDTHEELKLHFGGQLYSIEQLKTALKSLAPNIQKDINNIPENLNFQNFGSSKLIDNVSIESYINSLNTEKWVKSLLTIAYESEYGIAAGDQSCLNMITMLNPNNGTLFTDERYKIQGGNQSLTDSMSNNYKSQIHTGYALKAINKRGTAYELSFEGNAEVVKADFVVFAIPFTKLRQVDFNKIVLPDWKQKAIQNLSYGNNAKLVMGYTEHIWRKSQYSGMILSDNGVQFGWDSTYMQNKDSDAAGYTVFLGAKEATKLAESTPLAQSKKYLTKIETLIPGSEKMHNNKAARMCWGNYAWSEGSYSAYKSGQWTTIRGAEQIPVDNMFFAGEHCSRDFQGFMNGGAQTGREAAEAILKKIA